MDDTELFFHLRRMSRLALALRAPLDQWEAEHLRRVRGSFGEEAARMVRLQLDEAFIELVTRMDQGIGN